MLEDGADRTPWLSLKAISVLTALLLVDTLRRALILNQCRRIHWDSLALASPESISCQKSLLGSTTIPRRIPYGSAALHELEKQQYREV